MSYTPILDKLDGSQLTYMQIRTMLAQWMRQAEPDETQLMWEAVRSLARARLLLTAVRTATPDKEIHNER